VVTRFALAQLAQGAHATSIGESLSGPDVVSPRQYEKYAFANVKRIVSDLKACNGVLAYHICGNATPIIDKMAATGAAILELDYKADLTKIKAATRGKTCIHGPIDPSQVLAHGTPALVKDKCQEAIEILAPQGGFILAPGCALAADTPDENIDALIEAAQEYGRY
jgi:MtaA/CmuA family methyltransferase